MTAAVSSSEDPRVATGVEADHDRGPCAFPCRADGAPAPRRPCARPPGSCGWGRRPADHAGRRCRTRGARRSGPAGRRVTRRRATTRARLVVDRIGVVGQPSVDGRVEFVGQLHPSSLTRMTTDVLARIRTACAQVTAQATYVHIDQQQLESVRRHRCATTASDRETDLGRQRLGDDESTAAFVITLDAINFGSGYFPYLRKRDGQSGYHTVAASLRDHVTRRGPIAGGGCARSTLPSCNKIFDQPDYGARTRADGSVRARIARPRRVHCRVRRLVRDHSCARRTRARRGWSSNSTACRSSTTSRRTAVPTYRCTSARRSPPTTSRQAFVTMRPRPLRRPPPPDDVRRQPRPSRVARRRRAAVPPELSSESSASRHRAGSQPEVEIRAVGLHAVELLQQRAESLGRVDDGGQDRLRVVEPRRRRARYKAIPRHRSRSVFY